MSEEESHIPPELRSMKSVATTSEEPREGSERREYVLARIKTSEGGNPTIKEAREFGVSEKELTEYALRFLKKDIMDGYSLSVVRSIAEQSGVVTREEIDELYERTKAEILALGTVVETDEEKAKKEAAEAAWLAEMLEMCGE